MLKSLTVSNYRSLGESVRLELGSLTALVGPNGSGKSNVLDALALVADALARGLPQALEDHGSIGWIRRASAPERSVSIEVELELDGDEARYGFTLDPVDGPASFEVAEEALVLDGSADGFAVEHGKWRQRPSGVDPLLQPQTLVLTLLGGDARFAKWARALRSVVVYSILPEVMRGLGKRSSMRPLTRHGDNWISVLADPESSSWRADLVSALYKLTGDITDLEAIEAGDSLLARVQHRSPRGTTWLDASRESDGTLRVAGLLCALLQEPRPLLLAIEEPELTVHPGVIPLLYDYLRQAADVGQVIFTTHSPEMLDLLGVDEIRLVERRGGVTSIRPLSDDQRMVVEQRLMSLGELMRHEGLQSQEADEPEGPEASPVSEGTSPTPWA
jgi:predicted ATPase